MRYVAAYLLATLGGNENPSAADLEKILGSVGVDVDNEKLNRVINELKGKNLDELIAQGKSQLVIMQNQSADARSGEVPAKVSETKQEDKKTTAVEEDEDSDFDGPLIIF